MAFDSGASSEKLMDKDFSQFFYNIRSVDLLDSLPSSTVQHYLETKYAEPDDNITHVSFKLGQYLSMTTLFSFFILATAIYWLCYWLFMKWINNKRPNAENNSNYKIWSYVTS